MAFIYVGYSFLLVIVEVHRERNIIINQLVNIWIFFPNKIHSHERKKKTSPSVNAWSHTSSWNC